MNKKLLSLILTGVIAVGMVGCSSKGTVTIKYVDDNGNIVEEKVTEDEKDEAIDRITNKDNKEEAKESTKEEATDNSKEDVKEKEDNTSKITKKQDNKVTCVRCGKEDYPNNMWLTEDGYECNNCVHKCPYCGKQMTEFKPDQYTCTNPNCSSNSNYSDTEDYGEDEPGFIKDGTGLGEKEWNQDTDTTDDDSEEIYG